MHWNAFFVSATWSWAQAANQETLAKSVHHELEEMKTLQVQVVDT